MRTRWVVAAGLALLTAGCGETAAGPGTDGEPGWRAVAQSPLTPREAPLTVTVGEKILVIGGSDGPPCPPNADCVAPPEPLRDGAAYDPAEDAWTLIAEAPAPVGGGPDTAVVVGDVVYVLTTGFGADGTTTRTFQAYDAAADAWTELTPPDATGWPALTVAGDRVVAYAGSHESLDTAVPTAQDPLPADLAYDAATGTWTALPGDPLGPSYDRRLIGTPDGAVLLASDLVADPGVEPPVVDAARLDLETGAWTELPSGDVLSGYGFHAVGDVLVSALEGSADGGEVNNWGRDIPYGGILDPATGTWSALPDRPERDPLDGFMTPGDVTGERTIVSGAWVLDVPTETWTRVPELPVEEHVQGQSVAFADDVVFLWGGSAWGVDMVEGELLADGWVWTVPTPD